MAKNVKFRMFQIFLVFILFSLSSDVAIAEAPTEQWNVFCWRA